MAKDVNYSTDALFHGNTESVYNLCSGQDRKMTREEIIQIGHDFVKWAKAIKRPFRPGKFFRNLGWGWTTIGRWREKCPEFDDLYLEGKEELGEFRELGSIERKFDNTTVNNTLHLYIREYAQARKEDQELKASLAKADDKALPGSQEFIWLQTFAEISEKMKENK